MSHDGYVTAMGAKPYVQIRLTDNNFFLNIPSRCNMLS